MDSTYETRPESEELALLHEFEGDSPAQSSRNLSVAPSTTAVSVRPSQEHTTKDWEKRRELVTQYYIVEDKPLAKVKSMMAALHGFNATEKQYKRRIAIWNLQKNVKDADMRVILRKNLKRELEDGKESDFYINERLVPPHKMARFVKRHEMTDETILEEHMPTPAYITCTTPEADGLDSNDAPNFDDVHDVHDETVTDTPDVKDIGDLSVIEPPPAEDAAETESGGLLDDHEASTQSSIFENRSSSDHSGASTDASLKYHEIHEAMPLPSQFIDEVPDLIAMLTCFLQYGAWGPDGDLAKHWPALSPLNNKSSLKTWVKNTISDSPHVLINVVLILLYRCKDATAWTSLFHVWRYHDDKIEGRQKSLLGAALISADQILQTGQFDYEKLVEKWSSRCGLSVRRRKVSETKFMIDIVKDTLTSKKEWSMWIMKLKELQQDYHLYHLTSSKSLQEELSYSILDTCANSQAKPSKKASEQQAETESYGSAPPANSFMEVANRGTSAKSAKIASPRNLHLTRISRESPLERYSPRYHLSDSPDYYYRDISSSNPLSLLPPLPIQSSSLKKSVEPSNTQLKQGERNDDGGDEENEKELPSLWELDLALEWPPLEDGDGISF